jgi:hypothetical protein
MICSTKTGTGQERGMQQKPTIGAFRSSGFPAMQAPFLAVSLLASAAAAVGGALLYGTATQAALEQQWAAEVEHENDEICMSLGMNSASARSACGEALAKARRLQEERLSRERIL